MPEIAVNMAVLCDEFESRILRNDRSARQFQSVIPGCLHAIDRKHLL